MSFQPTGYSQEIYKLRYAFTPEETWAEGCLRVARQIALAELPEKQKIYEDKFNSILVDNLFAPGGRIFYGSGRANPNLLNCFVLGNQLDSKEGWGNVSKELIQTSMSGGGCGIDCSDVRPSGALISGHRGTCPGPLSLFQLLDGNAEPVKAGGERRVALMFSLGLDHPDVVDFMDAKQEKGKFTHANVSVRSTRTTEFLAAVQSDGPWELSWKGKYKKVVRAKELWDKIVKNSYNHAEPGFLNWELVENESNIWYIEKLATTNPCVTGDSLIAVADGRNAVSIKQLAEEGKDVPVYSTEASTGQAQIKWGRNPRKTGDKKEIWKLTLDDGSVLRATPDHKILTKELNYVELKDLKKGQSLVPFNSFNSNGYRQIARVGAQMKGGHYRNRRQYRIIAEFNGVDKDLDTSKFAIHHKDLNSLNDSFSNLEVLSHEEHYQIHVKNMLGQANPYHRMSDNWKKNFASHPGEKNPKWINITNEQLIAHGKKLYNREGKITYKNWQQYAKERNLPQSLKNKARFTSFNHFRSLVVGNHKVVSVEFCGYEDVYNITVEDNHNYHIITTTKDEKYITSSGIAVKNCGEIALSPYDCCCLGHLVLPRYVTDNKIDYATLANTIRLGVRFLDNVLSVNTYPMAEMREKSAKLRRIGLGTTGLADMLAMLGLRYGSEEGNKLIDKLYRFISKVAYEASILLAVEKGAFPACDPSKHLQSGFVRRMPAKIRSLIQEHGIRNCAILTQAPVGTMSIVSGNVSSGIEPMFSPAYERKYWAANGSRGTELVFHPLFARFMREGKDVSHFVGSHDLGMRDHLEVQKIVQNHVDNAVSKTINMPNDYPIEEMSKLWLEYLPHLKGTTFYREGTRGFVNEAGEVEAPPLTPVPLHEAMWRFNQESKQEVAPVNDCVSGVCEL